MMHSAAYMGAFLQITMILGICTVCAVAGDGGGEGGGAASTPYWYCRSALAASTSHSSCRISADEETKRSQVCSKVSADRDNFCKTYGHTSQACQAMHQEHTARCVAKDEWKLVQDRKLDRKLVQDMQVTLGAGERSGYDASKQSMESHSGGTLCTGASTEFNSGADLPSGYSHDANVPGYRRCAVYNVNTCKSDCTSLSSCNSMSHNGNCCFLYEASSCSQSSHSAASQYSFYTKITDPVNKGGNGCTTSSTCAKGEGDCDTDAQCDSGLMCYQREGYQADIPGLSSTAWQSQGYDFCFDPLHPDNIAVVTNSCPPEYWGHKQCQTCYNHVSGEDNTMAAQNMACTSCTSTRFFKILYLTQSGTAVGVCAEQPTDWPSLPSTWTHGDISNLPEALVDVTVDEWDDSSMTSDIVTWQGKGSVHDIVDKFVLTRFGVGLTTMSGPSTYYFSTNGGVYDSASDVPSGECATDAHAYGIYAWAKTTLMSKEDSSGDRAGSTYKSFKLIGMYTGYLYSGGMLPSTLYGFHSTTADVTACCTKFGGTIKTQSDNMPAWFRRRRTTRLWSQASSTNAPHGIGRSHCFITAETLADDFPNMLEQFEKQMPLMSMVL